MKYYDISEPISERTAVFPGDTPFRRDWVMRMQEGASCNVSSITMSLHCGTHTDAPLHYNSQAQDIASLDLTIYCGRCRVVDLAGVGTPSLVDHERLQALDLSGVTRLLIRTTALHDGHRFDPTFTALGPAAAAIVVARGMRLVGIDTPSMDHAESKDLAAHHVLERGGVALLENLDLTGVPSGDYELIALPLRIVGGDSSPVRAILRQIEP